MHPLEAAMHASVWRRGHSGVVREAHADAALNSGSWCFCFCLCLCFDDDVKSSDAGGPHTDLRNAIVFRVRRCPKHRETAPSANAAFPLTWPARTRARTQRPLRAVRPSYYCATTKVTILARPERHSQAEHWRPLPTVSLCQPQIGAETPLHIKFLSLPSHPPSLRSDSPARAATVAALKCA
ncbi:hypothetical protein GGP41_010498 [Bipolaris sorokiniana]|uniref:Uncharacterized protein n=1 Tax=Cochliobolus sativus TaxID=45130 RepID=A0A8H5ZML0_COCSA|nr:hypothetical protein GGP41_010498 [Bipolaris sorokiniana]